MWYFYVLQSLKEDTYFYRGSTGDLRKRLQEHNNGLVKSTKPKLPYRVVYYEAYLFEKAARIRESAVKNSGSINTPLLKRIKESLKE